MFRTVFGLVVGLAVGLALLSGEAPPQPEPQMVDLNVVALDNHGQAITDLTRDELRVTDNGKPQTIAFFRHRDSALGAAPALGPNEVSNRSRANVPRATVILFDFLNENFGTRGTVANRLIHDLESLPSADYLYLYCLTLDGRLAAIHGLPGPETEPPPPGGPPWTRQIKPLLDGAMRGLMQVRPVDDQDWNYRVGLTYAGLTAVGAELSRVPGRKSLVWLTDSVPIELGPRRSDTGDFVDFTPALRRLSEMFDRSGVAIYPVRQVMLGSPDSMGATDTSGLGGGGGNPRQTGMAGLGDSTMSASGVGSLDTLNQFAAMTGGRQDAGKDIGAAVRQAMTDARTSYQIAYYPPAGNWDNKFHKLRIATTRKGVRIQAKTGYYAWQEPPGAKSEQAIDAAIPTAFDAAEIGLRATLLPDPKDAHAMQLDAHIDAHDVVLVHAGDAYSGELRYAIAVYTPVAQPKRGPVTPLEVYFNAQDHDKALAQGIGLVQDMTLPADAENVRLIAFDRGSNAIGSVTMPVPEASPRKLN